MSNKLLLFIILKPSRVSNEDTTRFLEQRSLTFQSNNDRLEKELEKLEEKLVDLKERKTELIQEVISLKPIVLKAQVSLLHVHGSSVFPFHNIK